MFDVDAEGGRDYRQALTTSEESSTKTVVPNGTHEFEIELNNRTGIHRAILTGQDYMVHSFFDGPSVCVEGHRLGESAPSCYPRPTSAT